MPLILLIIWLIAEALVIGAVAERLGGLGTFIALLLIAAAGLRMMQRQGYRTLLAVQEAMQRNELPALTLLDSLIVFIAGVLLILPGFLSDGIALLLLFGGLRRRLARQAEQHIARRHPDLRPPTTLEGEFYEVTEEARPLPREDDEPSER